MKEKVAALVYKTEITAVGIRCADHATSLYLQKLALTSPISGGRSRTKATELLVIKRIDSVNLALIHTVMKFLVQ
jgi:hypothetical protein